MKLMQAIMSSRDLRPTMPGRFAIVVGLLLALLAPACEKKTVRTTPPVLVPSIESAPQPAPQPQPTPAPEPQVSAPESAPPATPEVPKPRPRPRKPVARKPAPPQASEAPKPEAAKPDPLKPEIAKPEPPRPIAPDNSAQITATVPSSAAQSQTQDTAQLLRSSQAKLAGLTRALNESEKAMAQQARNYISQSNEAMQQGELQRAYNLAVKASLLADELSK